MLIFHNCWYSASNATYINELMQSELATLQKEKGAIMGEKSVIEELKQKADKNVTELQVLLHKCVCLRVCACLRACDNLEITECTGGKSYPV